MLLLKIEPTPLVRLSTKIKEVKPMAYSICGAAGPAGSLTTAARQVAPRRLASFGCRYFPDVYIYRHNVSMNVYKIAVTQVQYIICISAPIRSLCVFVRVLSTPRFFLLLL